MERPCISVQRRAAAPVSAGSRACYHSAMSRPLILFAPAYGREIGGGHLVRSLSLSAALIDQGARALFAVPECAGETIRRFSPRPVETRVLTDASRLPELCDDNAPAAVVLDDYRLDHGDEQPLLRDGRILMAIDDLADRPHAVHLLLDPGQGRVRADYFGLALPETQFLLGPAYALLRPEFAAARETVGETRNQPERVLLSFGLGDVGRVTAQAVGALRELFPSVHLDVALGAHAPSLPELKRLAAADPRVSLHVETLEMAELMARADFAVGAGGSSTWERCCLGLPSIAVIVADNQRPGARALGDAGVLLAVDKADPDWLASLTAAAARLADPALRRRQRELGMALCDGRGAERAAEALLSRLR